MGFASNGGQDDSVFRGCGVRGDGEAHEGPKARIHHTGDAESGIVLGRIPTHDADQTLSVAFGPWTDGFSGLILSVGVRRETDEFPSAPAGMRCLA